MALTFGSLFAGIGGFDLGFERAGMQCAWQVEIDPYCQRVLAKHWPNVRRWDDVRTFPPEPIDQWRVDVICGGFPCHDISQAGFVSSKRKGITGERSGLWKDYLRIVCALMPRFVVIENVASLTVRGLDVVLCDLAASGFDAEWETVQASWFGIIQRRTRIFIVAYASGERLEAFPTQTEIQQQTNHAPWLDGYCPSSVSQELLQVISCGGSVVPDGKRFRDGRGVPNRTHRLRGLGNAVVPQVAEWIGRRIVEAAEAKTT